MLRHGIVQLIHLAHNQNMGALGQRLSLHAQSAHAQGVAGTLYEGHELCQNRLHNHHGSGLEGKPLVPFLSERAPGTLASVL